MGPQAPWPRFRLGSSYSGLALVLVLYHVARARADGRVCVWVQMEDVKTIGRRMSGALPAGQGAGCVVCRETLHENILGH
jgi:hypothetical protein